MIDCLISKGELAFAVVIAVVVVITIIVINLIFTITPSELILF